MARTPDLLPALLSHKSGLIDQALSEAMRHADPDEADTLADAVLSRDRPDRSVGLILRYHELAPETRYKIVERAEDLATALRKACSSRGEHGARNALAIIEQAASTRMAYLVTATIRHADPALRERAADCLRGLASRCQTHAGGQAPHLDAAGAKFLTDAVEQAVVMYANHAHPAVLEAFAQLVTHPMPEAWAALRSTEHPAIEPLGGLIAQGRSPAIRSALLAFLAVPALRVHAVHGLADACQEGQLDGPLSRGHLLVLPRVRRALRSAKEHHTLWPAAKTLNDMSPAAHRFLPALAQSLLAETQDTVLRLAGLSRSRHAATRLAALRRLLAIATRERETDPRAADNANDAIAAFAADTEPALTRTALWHLIRIQYDGLPRILAQLVNSRHPGVRAVAARHLAPLGFEKFWASWPKLDAPRRLTAGRALIKIDPDFHRHLGARLGSRDPATRLRAMGVIATLRQGSYFEQALIDLAGSDDPRVVASAVRALSDCTSEPARRVLSLALEHDDARIRANAVEALAKADAAREMDRLLAIAQDDVQRPRANAIKALMELRAREALPTLTTMLHDPRAEHRVSALWLVDELGLLQLAKQVAEMSITDDDERVKQRAGHVVQHLLDDLDRQLAEHRDATEAA